jgi:hypothetical protein
MQVPVVSLNENIWVEYNVVNLFLKNLSKSLKFVVCRSERGINILFILEELVFYNFTLLKRNKSVIQLQFSNSSIYIKRQ